MTAQKRDFDSFVYDHNASTPSLPGFSTLLGIVADNERHVQWSDYTPSYLQYPDPEYHFLDTAETTYPSLQADHFAQTEDDLAIDNLEYYDPFIEPLSQHSETFMDSHVSQDSMSQEPMKICYGMIYLSKAILTGSMTNVSNELKSLKQDIVRSHYLLDVVQSDEQLFVALPSGLKAAQLNRQVSEALQGPVLRGEVRLQALIHRETILNDIGRATTTKQSQISININVYGSSAMSQSIGNCLSQNKVWLQRPDWLEPDSTYDNPHVINFGEKKYPDAEVEIPSIDEAFIESSSVPVEDIYSKLSRASHLKGVAGDYRLATKLLPHQEEALEFMIQREQGPIPDEFRLWTEHTIDDVTEYRHKITGQRDRATPNEYGGGILADEMGTGKTLSALALITATLEEAGAWAHDREVHLSENIPAFKVLSRATLVVVPSPLLLETWKKELRKHMKTNLDFFVYHGTARFVDRAFLANHDLVLTTYQTLVADYLKKTDLITQIGWYRIILDEAHFIRTTSTFLHKRVAELDAKFRWCMTGTPIQNNLDDLGALFAFLSIAPFDRLGYYRKFISAKYAEGFQGAVLAAQSSLVKLLDAMCIRRTKGQVNLCPVGYTSRLIDFSPEERRQYNSMKADMKRAMENIIGESDSRRRFGSFQAKLQLRLLCNHGTYEDHFHWAKHSNLLDGYVEAVDGDSIVGTTACNICKSVDLLPSEDDSMNTSSCMHTLCTTCRKKSFGQCPLCDYGVRSRDVVNSGTDRAAWTSKSLRQNGYSSKMEALVHDLVACREDKSVVFSCWTTTLELVAQHLRKNNFRYEQIDGRMPFPSRQRILEAFSVDPSITVLIMTTGVGACGLDLIAANRVFLVEPQWNPSVESQAVSRTTRIGQRKTVQVTRYIMSKTVEEDFLKLQQRKRGLAQMADKTGCDSRIKPEHGN